MPLSLWVGRAAPAPSLWSGRVWRERFRFRARLLVCFLCFVMVSFLTDVFFRNLL